MIELSPVDSSFIESAGYDPSTGTMRVKMKNGNVYDHAGVSPERYAAFTGAKSPGRHYNASIQAVSPGKKITL